LIAAINGCEHAHWVTWRNIGISFPTPLAAGFERNRLTAEVTISSQAGIGLLVAGPPQLRVLGFGLLQDGDVSVGVFPEGQEISSSLSLGNIS
jgi:hypothetical protein